jgi:hypothetical protein
MYAQDRLSSSQIKLTQGSRYLKIFFQILGLIALLVGSSLITLKIMYQDGDGPSRLFPGGKLISGELHTGPEPEWSFTEDIYTIDLETADGTSRRIFVIESDGEIFVASGYMRSIMGKLWKQWAFDVEKGKKDAVIRVNNVRYERQLERVTALEASEGAIKAFAIKYAGGDTPETLTALREGVANGDMWVFRLAPRTDIARNPDENQ